MSIRLSEEEFAGLQRATNKSGVPSISDFCRNIILKSNGSTPRQDLHEVESRLGRTMTQLAERLYQLFRRRVSTRRMVRYGTVSCLVSACPSPAA